MQTWHQDQANNICKGYSVKTNEGKKLKIPGKELISWPLVFAQDIPQEAETTGNVCPALSLLYALIHTIHAHFKHSTVYLYVRMHALIFKALTVQLSFKSLWNELILCMIGSVTVR